MSAELAEAEAGRRHPALHIYVMRGDKLIADSIVDDDHAPGSLPMFHRKRSGYALHFTDDTHGTITSGPGLPWFDLTQMRGVASAHEHGYDLELREGARGRVEVGADTLQFEVVSAPPAPKIARDWWPFVAALLVTAGVVTGLLLMWRMAAISSSERSMVGPTTPVASSTSEATPPSASFEMTIPPVASSPPMSSSPSTVDENALMSKASSAVDVPASRATRTEGNGTFRDNGPLLAARVPVVGEQRHAPEQFIGLPDYTSDGYLKPEVVLRGIEQDRGAVDAAYEEALRRDPGLRGIVTARLSLDAQGGVTNVSVLRDTLHSPAVRQRLVDMIYAWRAPLPAAGAAEYELPFRFHVEK